MKQHVGGSSEMEGNGEEMVCHGDGGSAPAVENMLGKEKEELVPQLRFPAGFHFQPTDEELLDVYLRGKIEGRKPPLDVFMDLKILEWDPAKLVEERKAYGEGRYFFFTVRSEPRRKLSGGKASWKATGSPASILNRETGEIIGTKRILTYDSGDVRRDKWSMNEYVLTDGAGVRLGEWVLITIQEKLHWGARSSNGNRAADTRSKGKRGAGTRKEPKTTKRQKKAPSRPRKTRQQQQQQKQQQEITPDTSSDQPPPPPPLLTSDHHALHKEDMMIMALDEASTMVQAVAPEVYPDGDQHYLDTSEQPLMTHQQQGCHQAWLEEEQHVEFQGTSLDSLAVHDQFDVAHAQCRLDLDLDPFNNTMVHPEEPMLPWCQGGQQQQPGYIDQYQFFPPASSMDMEHAQYQPPQRQIFYQLGTQGFHGDFVGSSHDVLLEFPQCKTRVWRE